eukprot:COSAG05_NODE_2642_length_2811_cov_1.784661_2_plen_93_part_00
MSPIEGVSKIKVIEAGDFWSCRRDERLGDESVDLDMARTVIHVMHWLPGACPPQARARKWQSQGTYWGLTARARASADQNFTKFGHPSAKTR